MALPSCKMCSLPVLFQGCVVSVDLIQSELTLVCSVLENLKRQTTWLLSCRARIVGNLLLERLKQLLLHLEVNKQRNL